jgi:hypothetical protein
MQSTSAFSNIPINRLSRLGMETIEHCSRRRKARDALVEARMTKPGRATTYRYRHGVKVLARAGALPLAMSDYSPDTFGPYRA